MSVIKINGITYEGNSIIVNGNKIKINGKDVTPDTKVVNIIVEGDVDNISVDYCEKIIVKGNVKSASSVSGNIECQDVTNGVNTTSGDVECGNVTGSVKTMSGDVKAENIGGNVQTMSGDIKYRKQL